MHNRTVPEYRVLLSIDIEDYSKRTDAEQCALQEALACIVSEAASQADLAHGEWRTQINGDSIFAVLPAGTDLLRLMDVFVRELDAGLGGYNRRRAANAWTRMRLRLAVHAGPVHLDGPTGWPGQHAVLPGRLRDSQPVRIALRALRDADLAVIISADVYRDYITQGPGEPRPSEFRTVVAEGKDGNSGQAAEKFQAHLFIPRFNVHTVAALARFNVPDTHTAGRQEPPPANDRTGSPPAGGCADSRPPRQPTTHVLAGRDVIGRDRIQASGNSRVYQAGRDMTLGADHPADDDER
jgi:class 3 adenylate cyclase